MSVDHVFDSGGEVILIVPGVEHVEDPAVLDDGLHSNTIYNYDTQALAVSAMADKRDTTPKDIRVQVSAKHLMRGSSFFDKLLNGNWKEGREFQENGFIEITVQSWYIDPLLVVLHIVHGDLSKVPRGLDLEQLGNVAIIADYYGVPEVRFFADIWIHNFTWDELPHHESKSSDDIVSWLWISYFFQKAEVFTTCTYILMNNSDDEICSCDYPIPAPIICDMNDRRNGAIQGILEELKLHRNNFLDMIEGRVSDGAMACSLECASIRFGYISRDMYDLGLLSPETERPFFGVRYSLFRCISALGIPAPKEPCGCVEDCHCHCSAHDYTYSYSPEPLKSLYRDIDGLQLSNYVS